MNIYFPIQNKYYQWYQNLVNKAKKRKNIDGVYYENHHILPKCLGGNDKPDNLVSLTLREHYVAHLLLSKIYDGKACRKMHYALWRMLLQEKKRGSRIFEMYRKKYIETSLKTQIITDEFRQKVSKALIGTKKTKTLKLLAKYEKMKIEMVGSGNHMFGKKHTEKTKNIIANKAKGRKQSKETIEKRILKIKGKKRKEGWHVGEKNPMFNKKHSQETLLKIGAKSIGRVAKCKWINDGLSNKRLKPNNELPEGWVFGKIKLPLQGNINRQ